jgi:hypothetical protein
VEDVTEKSPYAHSDASDAPTTTLIQMHQMHRSLAGREFATQQKQLEDHTRAMHAPLLITDVKSHQDKDGGGERGEIMMNR